MLQIPGFRMESLANADHYKFHSDVIKIAKADATVSVKAADVLTKYAAAFEVEDENYELSKKSFDTDAITAADRHRDSVYSVLKKNVTNFKDLGDDTLAPAAKKLYQMLVDYNLSTSDNLNRESGKLLNIIDDCEKKYAAEVETLGLGVVVSTLKTANNEVIELMDSRADENSQKKTGALRESRAAVDDLCRSLFMLVNALIVVEGEENYAPFANRMINDIAYYKQYSLGQKSSSSSSSTDDSSNGGGSTGDDSSSTSDGDDSSSDSGDSSDSGSDGGSSDSGDSSDSGSDSDDDDVKF